ncbi:MAG TPA: hypothetical protein ENG38_02225, partial [Thermoplasmatales archaeon]|nr:hypothetical protein [Thermoplasmatales archaeon]HEX08609.1 hypothetical protein [Thermoplasmatales archaeon]
PYFDRQWALKKIEASDAWNIETGDPSVIIAVIDTGIDYTHPDISDNVWINNGEDINHNGRFDNWPFWLNGDIDWRDNDGNGFVDDVIGFNFVSSSPTFIITLPNNAPKDDNGHGTHCAGIASAATDNGIGIAGVSWNCKIMAVKGFDSTGKGVVADLAECIVYAADNNADIISMSWGRYSSSQLEKDALDYAYSKGVILIAAAGNEDIWSKFYPAAYENVIAVAASDESDCRVLLSNWGSNFGSWIDVAAPGTNILSLRAKGTDMYGDGAHIVDKYYYIASGSSMACPHVAGLAALILSKAQRDGLNLKPIEVKTILCSSTDEITSTVYTGVGRINAYKALQKITSVVASLDPLPDEKEEVQGEIKIKGIAEGKNFQQYIVEYGKGIYPTKWTKITESDNPKKGVLALWNTVNLNDGAYTIRLKVKANGNSYEDRVILVVDNKNNTFYVDVNGKKGCRCIQTAVNDAGNGDSIYVYKGTYYENLYIYRSINLSGEDRNNTIVDGNLKPHVVKIYEGSKVKLNGFKIVNSYYSNIWLGYSSLITISNNIIYSSKNSSGILLGRSSNNNISNNIISNNANNGIILLDRSSNNIISANIISNNAGNGILLGIIPTSPYNIISNNIISSNGESGILLLYPSGNRIFGNTIFLNSHSGIHLEGGVSPREPTEIFDNNISHNYYGIYAKSPGYIIYHNNFVNNKENAYAVWPLAMDNRWDDGSMGNYWSDYEERYPNAKENNGVWSIPYRIPGKIIRERDRYPLVKPWKG